MTIVSGQRTLPVTMCAISVLVAILVCWSSSAAQTTTATPDSTPTPSKFRSADDGWLDVSGFLDEKYGFLPVVIPITEPAVGYGAAVGLAFISQPLGQAKAGFGRPDITIVGGLATENGSWGGVRPFISLRGAPIMRYQGEEVAQIETELRSQFWKRFSLVGFAGTGAAWTDFTTPRRS